MDYEAYLNILYNHLSYMYSIENKDENWIVKAKSFVNDLNKFIEDSIKVL